MPRATEVIDALEARREQENRLAYEHLTDLDASHVYTVSVADDGGHWAVEVRGIPGLATKASRLDYALQTIRELIAAEDRLDPRSIELNVVIKGRVASTSTGQRG